MVEFEYVEAFDYPAGKLFAFLADLSARRDWMPGILDQEITPHGEARHGTTYYEYGKFSGFESKKTFAVTEFEQDHLLTLTTVPGSEQMYQESFRIKPLSESSCEVQFFIKIDAPKVAGLFIRQTLKKSMPESVQHIKAALAAGA